MWVRCKGEYQLPQQSERAKSLSLGWMVISSSVNMEKDQVIFRSDAKALIKLNSVILLCESQGHLQV